MFSDPTRNFWGLGLILMHVLLAPCRADEGVALPSTPPAVPIPEPVASLSGLDFYAPQQEVEGDVFFFGSQTLQQVATIWSDSFRELHPNVAFNIDCQGSETALPVIPDQRRMIGLMSRPLTSEEHTALEQKKGCRIAEILICHDAMGIIVHKSNPIAGFTDASESAILTKTGTTDVASIWSELNVAEPLGTQPISILGPNKTSGTRRYLESRLLGSQAGSRPVKEYSTRDELIEAVSQDPAGISLVSLSHGEPDGTRVVPVAGVDGVLISPSEANLLSRRYPFIRPLYLVVALNGETLDDPLMMELLSYVLSRSGQEDVMKDGFLPLTHGEAVAQKEKLGWNEVR
ncbi:MAG: PstS family phosphate ABC transporter substrate-binding protein [Planctomycetota bacterium]